LPYSACRDQQHGHLCWASGRLSPSQLRHRIYRKLGIGLCIAEQGASDTTMSLPQDSHPQSTASAGNENLSTAAIIIHSKLVFSTVTPGHARSALLLGHSCWLAIAIFSHVYVGRVMLHYTWFYILFFASFSHSHLSFLSLPTILWRNVSTLESHQCMNDFDGKGQAVGSQI